MLFEWVVDELRREKSDEHEKEKEDDYDWDEMMIQSRAILFLVSF